MNIPESFYGLLALCIWTDVRNIAEAAFLKELKEAVRLADNQRDIWLHQRCEAE